MLTFFQAAVRAIRNKLAAAFVAPPSVDRYDHRTYYSMLMANFMALLLHLSWTFIFYGLQFTPLSLINAASVLITD